jgi:hypothetical protein
VTAPRESAKGDGNATGRNCDMAEHKQGSMDIRAQEKTFEGFIKLSTWGAVISICVLIIMALANA